MMLEAWFCLGPGGIILMIAPGVYADPPTPPSAQVWGSIILYTPSHGTGRIFWTIGIRLWFMVT